MVTVNPNFTTMKTCYRGGCMQLAKSKCVNCNYELCDYHQKPDKDYCKKCMSEKGLK